MKRQKEACLLGEIIRLARTGHTQAAIAGQVGISPDKVYKLCKRYGIKTRRIFLRDKKINAKLDSIQLRLPI